MKHCARCGQQAADQSRFCTGCGAALLSPEPNPLDETTAIHSCDMPDPASGAGAGHNPGCGVGAVTSTEPLRKPRKSRFIAGVILVMLLLAGGFWGSQTFSTEARIQKRLDLAVKYLCDNDYEKAILAFNEAIKIDPKEAKPYQGLARVYTLQGKYDEAKAAYDQGITAVASDEKQILQLGLAGMYIDQGALVQAETAFQTVKDGNPTCLEAYWGLAMVYQKQGNNSKAEAMLLQSVQNNPESYRACNILALFLNQNGKTDSAVAILIKSLILDINQQEAYLVLKDIYQGRYAELAGAGNLTANQQLAAQLQFYSSYLAEDYPAAAVIYMESLAQDQNNLKARILAAAALVKTGDQPGAKGIIANLDEKKLTDGLLSDLAQYYLAAGDKEKARKYAIKASQANGTNLEAIALLQNLNSQDACVKTYTAQAMLYNWKPVTKVTEELQAVHLPVLASGSNPNSIVAVRLTTDYWIPDISKKYLWADNRIRTWKQTGDGRYQCEDHWIGAESESDNYRIQGDYVYWTGGAGGGNGSEVTAGQRVMIGPMTPGQTWENTYTENNGGRLQEFHETRIFVGLDQLIFMEQMAHPAHIHVTRRSTNPSEPTCEEDLWLIYGVGVVKRTWSYNGRQYSEIMTEVVAELNLSTDQQLAVAVEQNDTLKAGDILKAGASPNARDEYGNIVLSIAAAKKNLDITNMLIARGANVNQTTLSGGTALNTAAFCGSTEVVKALLAAGANPNVKDVNKSTPLLAAAGRGYPDIVRILLAAGADIDARDLWGSTSLIGAARDGKMEIVQILLDEGANVNLTNNDGKTAVYCARKNNHTDVVNLLVQNGARG